MLDWIKFMNIELFLQEKSWIALIVYILIKEIWPFFRDKIYPSRMAEEHLIRERRVKMEERALKNDERNIIAFESMSLAVQHMTLALTSNNERLSTLIADQARHATFMSDAIADMREKVAAGHADINKR